MATARPISRLRRPRVLVPLLVIAGVALAVALALFQPWRLFTSTTVIEAAPEAAPIATAAAQTATAQTAAAQTAAPADAAPGTIAAGRFVSHEHATSGSARLLRLADGSTLLRLENLDTSDGPDLHVWLTDRPVLAGRDGWRVFDDGRYLDLGPLKGNKGDQNYAVPAGTDLSSLTSVSVWCARFRVSFGAAALR